MIGFSTISNYFSIVRNKFDTIYFLADYPKEINDNITTIYPDGKAEIDDGDSQCLEGTFQIFRDLPMWDLISNKDSVVIYDVVGLPSIHSTWDIVVTEGKIELTRQGLEHRFKESSKIQEVEFKKWHYSNGQYSACSTVIL